MTDRTAARTNAAAQSIRQETGVEADRIASVTLDGAEAQSVRDAVTEIAARFGRIDILVNNAGSTGPKPPIEHMPISRDELAALQKRGSIDTETVGGALCNIFGVGWNLARTAAPHTGEGGRSSPFRRFSLAPILCPYRLCRPQSSGERSVTRAILCRPGVRCLSQAADIVYFQARIAVSWITPPCREERLWSLNLTPASTAGRLCIAMPSGPHRRARTGKANDCRRARARPGGA